MITILNHGKYFWCKSDAVMSDWKYLVFQPDGMFDMKYTTQAEAEARCNAMNANGQPEQRVAEARQQAANEFYEVFLRQENDSIIWNVAALSPRKLIPPSTY